MSPSLGGWLMILLVCPYMVISDGSSPRRNQDCQPAVVEPSKTSHLWAQEGLQVSRLAFSSCWSPESLEGKGDTFWAQVRAGEPDLWLWLGDNVYNDGTDMDFKRRRYNIARNEASYLSQGPVKEGAKIPVLATWDDHDCCTNDAGNDFPCMRESQNEFVRHFNVPQTEPMHWDYPGGQQAGVYSSRIFTKPGSREPGLQVIMLDARSARDPTYSFHGACQGSSSRMLSPSQWSWLEEQLARRAEVTLIASGVQVLQPTDQTKIQPFYCADDSHSGGGDTFQQAIAAVGEGDQWPGAKFEDWAEIPQERARLLTLAQRTLNEGNTKAVIFLSGDQHWGELLAKRMPSSEAGGSEQVLYEVTASGVYADWPGHVANGNRLRARSCDHQGTGPANQACVFPFSYQGTIHSACALDDESGTNWCSTRTLYGVHVPGFWGVCAPPEQELAQTVFSNSSRTCSDSPFHICEAQANYGFLDVDFSQQTVRMGVRTPEEREEIFHEIHF